MKKKKRINFYNGLVRCVVDDYNDRLLEWAIEKDYSWLLTNIMCRCAKEGYLNRLIQLHYMFKQGRKIKESDNDNDEKVVIVKRRRVKKKCKRSSSKNNAISDEFQPLHFDRSCVCASAAEGGQLHILKWLINISFNEYKWDHVTCSRAARAGQLHVLKFCRGLDDDDENDEESFENKKKRKKCDWNKMTICIDAAEGGNLKTLKWLITNQKCPVSKGVCNAAAEYNHLHILQWLHRRSRRSTEDINNNCPWSDETVNCSAKGQNLEILKWLIFNGCPVNLPKLCRAAAIGGSIEILEWIHQELVVVADNHNNHNNNENNEDDDIHFFWTEQVCTDAARVGNLQALKWLRNPTIRCPWNEKACISAAFGGHLNVLQYLIANECPCDKAKCFRYAKSYGHYEMLHWMRQQGEEGWTDDVEEDSDDY